MWGCGSNRGSTPGAVVSEEQAWAFAPTSARVHPLTRVVTDQRGRAAIDLHVELTDRWGDTVKSTGKLRLELFRVAPGVDASRQRERTWEIDLSNLSRNAELFDPATRTYRVRLEEAPGWLVAPSGNAFGEIGLVAITAGPNGRESLLRASYRLGR